MPDSCHGLSVRARVSVTGCGFCGFCGIGFVVNAGGTNIPGTRTRLLRPGSGALKPIPQKPQNPQTSGGLGQHERVRATLGGMSAGWSGGSTWGWRKVRARVLERDGYRCQLRLDGCTVRATHVHHLHGKGSGDDPAGLVSSCEHCNLKIGDPTRADPTPKRATVW